jgi:glycosyltransferase involved in cell wall biosynthesis
MRVLLAHNSLYYPSYGGGDKSNRLLMEALAARGHTVRVAARVEEFGAKAHHGLFDELARRGARPEETGSAIRMQLGGVDVRVLTRNPHLRAFFATQIEEFDPDIILASTDDPAHLLLEVALRAPRARVVYMVRATIAAPFGPHSSMPSAAKTEALRQADGIVAVSESAAAYAREWGGLDAVHVPISLLDPGEHPCLGRFDNRFVIMVNPCAMKGISIFLALAERFPDVRFAAVPTWGTTTKDLAALRARPNISVLAPFDDFDDLLKDTRVALVPSLWAEARSRVILEAMSRGIPVVASDVGGLSEAKLGVDYLLPVNPVVRYQPAVDELMVPVADIPEQDVGPWEAALRRLLTDRAHYEQLSADSRKAALAYARDLNVLLFEAYLETILRLPKRQELSKNPGDTPERIRKPNIPRSQPGMSPDSLPAPLSSAKRKLLALRLKRTGPTANDTE